MLLLTARPRLRHPGRVVVLGALPAAVVLVVGVWSPSWSLAVLGTGVVALLLLRLGRCWHPGPLGLLPPVVGQHGERLPARWYCDRCTKSWPADFDREQTPIPRFTGYDQSKASHAAKRADELASRQRTLALERGGMAKMSKPIPIHVQGRRLAG